MIILWVKVLHILAVVSWMAGLLYLPRLFVYHFGVAKNSEQSELFKIMEYKLYKYIMTNAMYITWITGLFMAYKLGYTKEIWFIIKFIAVILLTFCHFYLNKLRIQFFEDRNTKTTKFFRWLNEVPTLLMIVIVICVIIKPF